MRQVTYVTADKFSIGIKDIMDTIDVSLRANLNECVRESCKMGARLARRGAKKLFKTNTSNVHGRYSKNFSYQIKSNRDSVIGEIGNRKYPGLVHLLEKGHRTINGARSASGGIGTINMGSVPAYPHLAPAADETFDHFNKVVKKALDKALK